MRALMLGRFQPFHKGHLLAIKNILAKADKLIIAVGSSQYSHTLENPFTAGERHQMIARSLEAEAVSGFYIIPVTDLNVYGLWVRHVVNHVPPFDRVYATNPLTSRLFKEQQYEVHTTPLYERERYSGTHIREFMLSNGPWQELVPPEVVNVIGEINGMDRIQEIARTRESRKFVRISVEKNTAL